jgi:hypothetical protein
VSFIAVVNETKKLGYKSKTILESLYTLSVFYISLLHVTGCIRYLFKANMNAKLAIAASPPERQSIATHFLPGTCTLYLTPAR